MTMTRSEFMRTIVVGGGALAAGGIVYAGRAMAQTTGGKKKKDRGPRLSLEQVEKFVRAAHVDLDATRSLLDEQPKLVNAAWDWGGGDWETGLGGAAHMGRPDIALHLLEHGARMDIFAAAMLGKLAIVKAAIDAYPETRHVLGPHGIPLMKHAQKGGDAAKPVVEYLESLEK